VKKSVMLARTWTSAPAVFWHGLQIRASEPGTEPVEVQNIFITNKNFKFL